MSFSIRTIDSIFQTLLLEKQTLTGLTSLSTTITDVNTLITQLTNGTAPEWVLWLYNMAIQTHLTDVAIQTGIDDINDAFDTQIIPTERWYVDQAKKFQYGDTVLIDPTTYQPYYAIIDTNKQIIESCTTREYQNKLILKVKRTDTNILSAAELASFTSYINHIKAAGTQTLIQNYSGDELTLNMTILYDASVSDLSATTTAVEAEINDYLVNLEFDSKFLTSSLIDRLQALTGIVDPRFDSGVAVDTLGTSTSFTHEYTTYSGWAQINSLTPLSSTITYTNTKQI